MATLIEKYTNTVGQERVRIEMSAEDYQREEDERRLLRALAQTTRDMAENSLLNLPVVKQTLAGLGRVGKKWFKKGK